MLSFLQEQESENAKPDGNPGAYGQKQKTRDATRNTHDARRNTHDEYLTIAARQKNVRKTTYLLAVLFGMGLLCLWFMIKKSTPQIAAATSVDVEEMQVETAIAQLSGAKAEMSSDIDKIVGKFYQLSDTKQVQVNKLKKNPFRTETLLGSLKQIPETEELDHLSAAGQQQAKNFELLTICQLDKGRCCMINDRLLYEGDSIRGFKVHKIGDSFVELRSGSKKIVLEIKK